VTREHNVVRLTRIALLLILAAVCLAPLMTAPAASSPPGGPVQPGSIMLPNKENSVRFAVIGDSGTGDQSQYQVAEQMSKLHEKFPFDFVLMLGDNIYGSSHPRDFEMKFELPYKPLLSAGVKFYASLGNHDNPNQRFYEPFNMGGERYYAFKKGPARFFVLDSGYMNPKQLTWLEQNLRESGSAWKICFFHHPLYSDGKFHGPDTDLRAHLEPLFEKYGVDVVLSGHEHFYERLTPQHGINYFILGNSGQLRSHDLRRSAETAKGFDTDRTFMLVEVAGDELYFQTISRTGQTVDSERLVKQKGTTGLLSTEQGKFPQDFYAHPRTQPASGSQ
jgi:predicted phosphodiesterase